jgi:hypothetical protein
MCLAALLHADEAPRDLANPECLFYTFFSVLAALGRYMAGKQTAEGATTLKDWVQSFVDDLGVIRSADLQQRHRHQVLEVTETLQFDHQVGHLVGARIEHHISQAPGWTIVADHPGIESEFGGHRKHLHRYLIATTLPSAPSDMT